MPNFLSSWKTILIAVGRKNETKRPAKKRELESSLMLSLAFFRIAPQPAKRLKEAGFNIETNQGFFKD